MYMHTIPLVKLSNIRKRKSHHTPNGIYSCILPYACWKSPEMAWQTNQENRLHISTEGPKRSFNDNVFRQFVVELKHQAGILVPGIKKSSAKIESCLSKATSD